MNEGGKTELLKRIAEQAVPDTLDLWPEIGSQVGTARAPRFPRTGAASTGRSGHRRLVIGLCVAVMLALVIGGTFPLWNHAEPVDAQAVLDRAQATVDSPLGVNTYHLKMTRQVIAKGNQTISTEVWFGGPDRQRSTQVARDGSGVVASTSDVVFNGDQTWIATTENGQTRVIHAVGTKWNKPADDPNRANSLTGVLAEYGNAKEGAGAQGQGEDGVARQAAQIADASAVRVAKLQGEATVANRAAYVIEVTASPKSVDGAISRGSGAEYGARWALDGKQVAQEQHFGEMIVWVDKQTYLPLKTEVRDPSGAVIDRSEVTSVEYNIDMPDSIFSYTPPAGATVSNFTGGTGADVKRILIGGPQSMPTPPNKRP